MTVQQDFAVDQYIPIPDSHAGRRKYNWHELNVQGSFLVRCEDNKVARKRCYNTLTSCKTSAERTTGFKFVLRRWPGGVRVWRIE